MSDNKKASPKTGEAENMKMQIPKGKESWYNEEVDRVDVLADQSLDLSINFLRWLVMGGLSLLGVMSAFPVDSVHNGTLCNNIYLQIGIIAIGLGILCGGLGLYGYVELRKHIVDQRLLDIQKALQNDVKTVGGGGINMRPFYKRCVYVSFLSFAIAVLGLVLYLTLQIA